jgi:acyl-CoA synthetase (AMP-forming)/AMP-acid ligase II
VSSEFKKSMVDLLRHRAQQQGTRSAYVFLGDGEAEHDRIDYAILDRRARTIAARLLASGGAGERVLLLFPPGLDYLAALFGCMYAGALAVPAPPPNPARLRRTLPQLSAIARDAEPRFVLTVAPLLELEGLVAEPTLARASWLATDDVDAWPAPWLPEAWQDPQLGPEHLAYLQYTSGSTAAPRGVMISHGNLLHQLDQFDQGYAHTPDSVMVTWLPGFHDLGLVYGLLMPLYVGFRCVVLPPLRFLERPARLLRAISHYRGTHVPGPNFAFDLLAARTDPAELVGLDLSSWIVALNGAEPIRSESESRFLQAFAAHGLRPNVISHAMGMSEATSKISSEPAAQQLARFLWIDGAALERNRVQPVAPHSPGARELAGLGTPALDTRLRIVDPEARAALPEGHVGELWVASASVAQGYWGNPEATEQTFRARLLDEPDAGPFLRTGDLGFVWNGELFLTGRLKDVIIIRGQNHHPQDLEWTVRAAHPSIRPNCAAVFCVPDIDGQRDAERLVLVTEVEPELADPPEPVFSAIRTAILEGHDLRLSAIVLLPPRQLPKTTSGKIQRRRCRELFTSAQLEAIASWQEHEQTHAIQWLPLDPIDSPAPARAPAWACILRTRGTPTQLAAELGVVLAWSWPIELLIKIGQSWPASSPMIWLRWSACCVAFAERRGGSWS